jgi:hypothetical protein
MREPVSATFVMHAQYCLARCCHYVDGGPVSEDRYEVLLSRLPSPARQTQTPRNPMAFQEVMIPCQNVDLHKAVGQQIGFYLGEPRDRTAVFTIKFSGPLNVYDAKSREYLRIATEEDVKKWNDAIEAGVRKAGELEKNWPRKDHENTANGPGKSLLTAAWRSLTKAGKDDTGGG